MKQEEGRSGECRETVAGLGGSTGGSDLPSPSLYTSLANLEVEWTSERSSRNSLVDSPLSTTTRASQDTPSHLLHPLLTLSNATRDSPSRSGPSPSSSLSRLSRLSHTFALHLGTRNAYARDRDCGKEHSKAASSVPADVAVMSATLFSRSPPLDSTSGFSPSLQSSYLPHEHRGTRPSFGDAGNCTSASAVALDLLSPSRRSFSRPPSSHSPLDSPTHPPTVFESSSALDEQHYPFSSSSPPP